MGDELPLGAEVDWTPVKPPSRAPLRGSHILLRPVDAAADADALFAVSHPPDGDPAIWTYLPYGPYEAPDEMLRLGASPEAFNDHVCDHYWAAYASRGSAAGAHSEPSPAGRR